MSLLGVVCCPVHGSRTCLVWDDPQQSSELWTYGYLRERVVQMACKLRKIIIHHINLTDTQRPLLVGIYSSTNADFLSAMLSVLALPAAYCPVDLSKPPSTRWLMVTSSAMPFLLVHLDMLQEFLSHQWVMEHCLAISQEIADFGFVVVSISHSSDMTSLPRLHEQPEKVLSTHLCSPTLSCDACVELSDRFSHRGILAWQSETELEGCIKELSARCNRCLVCSELGLQQTFSSPFLPTPPSPPLSLAYLLHTTGTTGFPKQVWTPHCCVVPNILDLSVTLGVEPDDRVFNAAPMTFDPSVVEVFLALSAGATLIMVPAAIKMAPSQLASVLFHRQQITVLQATPTLVQLLPTLDNLLGDGSCVRVLAFGGEVSPSLGWLARWKSPKNQTSVFNLYGITEVSCWASCETVAADQLRKMREKEEIKEGKEEEGEKVEKEEEEEASISGAVSLGQPLSGTCVELRDERGKVVTSGAGRIWIGGQCRVCAVGEEACLVPDTMRDSGDWGYISGNGKLYFVGRTDRQLKRGGIRINLDHIQLVISSSSLITTAAVLSLDQTSFPHSWSPLASPLLVAVMVPSEPSSEEEMRVLLMQELTQQLPSAAIPDKMVFVSQLPMNAHGKVDVKAVRELISHQIMEECTAVLEYTPAAVTALLTSCAAQVLGLHCWPEEKSLAMLGASSFDVVRLLAVVEDRVGMGGGEGPVLSSLFEPLLAEPLHSIVNAVVKLLLSSRGGERDMGGGHSSLKHGTVTGKKRSVDIAGMPEAVPPSKHMVERSLYSEGQVDVKCWRRGQILHNGRSHYPVVTVGGGGHPVGWSCKLEVLWSVPTGQCVDASPLVVQKDGEEQCTAYIGSHSGLFLAIEVASGSVLWQTKLGDRVESSACVSQSGRYISVGCYDGCLYTLLADTGEVHWCMSTAAYSQGGGGRDSVEPIKSSPVLDPATGLLWVGSHDQHLYAVDIEKKEVVHRVFLGGGSCFSSPCVLAGSHAVVCAATLQGRICGVAADTGKVVWKYQCPKPVFSSPTPLPNGHVACGCIDNNVYVISQKGELLTQFLLWGSVFSSCAAAFIAGEQTATLPYMVFCGSHDHHVYCWEVKDGGFRQVWQTLLDSEVYAIPCVSLMKTSQFASTHHTLSADQAMENLSVICVCSSNGWLYVMDAARGSVLGRVELPWDVFSSPVLLPSGKVVVGCRDDSVYCVNVNVIQF